MAVEITGQRWKVLAYADVVAAVPQDGEMYVLSGVPSFEAPRVAVVGDGSSTVVQLAAMRQTRPIYAYGDVDTDIPEAGTQVAITGAPDTTQYVVIVTGDGTHTIAELVANYVADISGIAAAAVPAAIIGLAEVNADYTLQATDETIIVTTADAVTLTIPEGLPIGKRYKISRTVASTNAVTAAKTGSDTIEGGASFVTHGSFAELTLNDAEVVIEKKTATSWKFINGVVAGSTSVGVYKRYPDGSSRININASLSSAITGNFRGMYRSSGHVLTLPDTLVGTYCAVGSPTLECTTVYVFAKTSTTLEIYYMLAGQDATVTTRSADIMIEGKWK